jgi:hypothetical protein
LHVYNAGKPPSVDSEDGITLVASVSESIDTQTGDHRFEQHRHVTDNTRKSPNQAPDKSEHPDMILKWNSRRGQHDSVVLKNIGHGCAVCIGIGDFSWPDLEWHKHIEAQAIDPGTEEPREAEFTLKRSWGTHELIPMRDILALFEDREPPLSIPIRFSDSHGTKFVRPVTLHRGRSSDVSVIVKLGILSIE